MLVRCWWLLGGVGAWGLGRGGMGGFVFVPGEGARWESWSVLESEGECSVG